MTDFELTLTVGNTMVTGKCRLHYEIYQGERHCTVASPYCIYPQELYPYRSKGNPLHATTNHAINEEICEDVAYINSLQGKEYTLGQLKRLLQEYVRKKKNG